MGGLYILLLEGECKGGHGCALLKMGGELIPDFITVLIIFLIPGWFYGRLKDRYGVDLERGVAVREVYGLSHETTSRLDDLTNRFVPVGDMSDAERILVMANTGQNTIHTLLNYLTRERFASKNIPINVLLRSPSVCDGRRAHNLSNTVAELKRFATTNNIKVDVRYYGATSPFRCVLVEHSSQTHSGYLSFYDWPESGRGPRSDKATLNVFPVNKEKESALLDVFLSWYRHFWGFHHVHTIVFDFDDTLFLTTKPQVAAWVDTIQTTLEHRLISVDDLKEEVAVVAQDETKLTTLMQKIFLEEQQEPDILKRILKTKVTQSTSDFMRARRTETRHRLTVSQAERIESVINDVRELHKEFQLVIVSASEEDMIRKVLDKNQLDLFSYIIGRETRELTGNGWWNVEAKAQHFIKVSATLGVPLDRMVFVGDSDSDYKAARQVRLAFIENKCNAIRYKVERETLIDAPAADRPPFITGSKDGELISEIRKIDAALGIAGNSKLRR